MLGSNPVVIAFGLLLNLALILLGPAVVVFILVVLFVNDQTCVEAAQRERAMVDAMGLAGPAFAWNLAHDWVGPAAATVKAATWFVVAGYRAFCWAALGTALLPLAFAWYQRGRATQLEDLAMNRIPKQAAAYYGWTALGVAVALPAVHILLPWHLYTPLSVPVLGLSILPLAWYAGRHMPIQVL